MPRAVQKPLPDSRFVFLFCWLSSKLCTLPKKPLDEIEEVFSARLNIGMLR